jgi:hypothetical protein
LQKLLQRILYVSLLSPLSLYWAMIWPLLAAVNGKVRAKRVLAARTTEKPCVYKALWTSGNVIKRPS